MTTVGRWSQPLVPSAAGQAASEAPTMPVLCGWIQEAAVAHATALGLGMASLGSQGLTWMLGRFRLKVRRKLTAIERLSVTTWPSGVERLLARREFVVVDPRGSGEPLVLATSGWLLVDTRSRRPVRPGPFVAHLAIDERALDLTGRRLSGPARVEWSHTQPVRGRDIDVNGHVTNTRYLAWIEDALRDAALVADPWSEIEIDFVSEVLAGQHVRTEGTEAGDRCWTVALLREEDDSTVAVARVRT